MDHYEALGVPANARAAEIRRAYLASARAHHPDFHAGDDPGSRAAHALRMQQINEAWRVLGDPARRADYDLSRSQPAATAGDRERIRPDARMPAGKGWTPRAGDDAWMYDFDAWADERDRFDGDEDEVSGRRNPVAVIPVALFLISVLAGFMGMVFYSRALLAGSIAGVVLSSVLFVLLPLIEMTRRRTPRGRPSETARRTPFSGR